MHKVGNVDIFEKEKTSNEMDIYIQIQICKECIDLNWMWLITMSNLFST